MSNPTKITCVFGLLLAVSACSIEQQNGELTTEPAPVFTRQDWRAERDGYICMLTAGELQVAVHDDGPVRVGTSRPMSPAGYVYKVLVNGHRYETHRQAFTVRESQAIVHDLMNGNIAYTEWTQPVGREGAEFHRYPNKIYLDNFDQAYAYCSPKTIKRK